MKNVKFILFSFILLTSSGYTATPVWTFSSPTPAVVAVAVGEAATAAYIVTNQSNKPKNLFLKAQTGLSASNCYLAGKGSTCTLIITVNGNLIPATGISTGPILCEQTNANQCYQPALANQLQVRRTSNVPPSTATINVSPTSLAFVATTQSSVVTLTNQSLSIGLTNLQITLPVGLTLDPSSTCTQGGNLAAASSCTLIFTAATVLGNVNVTIQGDNSNSLTLPITVKPRPTRVAVGRTAVNTPISYISLDDGQNWVASTGQPQGSGQLLNVSCNDSGLNCVAVGRGATNQAISYRSVDGGDTWSTASAGDIPVGASDSIFNKVFCDSNTALQCVAVGNYNQSGLNALVNISLNGGQTWNLAATPPIFSELLALSCDSTATRCTTGGAAGMFYSLNSGEDWTIASSFPPMALVRAIVCDSASPMNCAAGGEASTLDAFASYTTDNGENWSQSNIIPPLANVTINALGCSSNLSNCIGMQGSTFEMSVNIFQSTDMGQTWNQIGLLPVVNATSISTIFCNSSGQNCTAVGGIFPPSQGVSYYSTNGGTSWVASNLPTGSVVLTGVSGQR